MTDQLAIGLFFALTTCALGQNTPKSHTIPAATLSPDHRYGVTVPVAAAYQDDSKLDDPKNCLIDMENGQELTVMPGDTGWDRMNHGGVLPSRWSPDGSLLLWQVDRKWCPGSLVLLKVEGDKVKWQTDILQAVQQAILARTKKVAPQKYAAAKKENEGIFDPALDGFIIDARASDPGSFPLHVEAVLTSDPKSFPAMWRVGRVLNASLNGRIDTKGRFTVTSFHLGHGKWDRF